MTCDVLRLGGGLLGSPYMVIARCPCTLPVPGKRMGKADGKIAVLMLSCVPQPFADGKTWVTLITPLPRLLVNVLQFTPGPGMPLPETLRKLYCTAREVLVHPKQVASKIETVS